MTELCRQFDISRKKASTKGGVFCCENHSESLNYRV